MRGARLSCPLHPPPRPVSPDISVWHACQPSRHKTCSKRPSSSPFPHPPSSAPLRCLFRKALLAKPESFQAPGVLAEGTCARKWPRRVIDWCGEGGQGWELTPPPCLEWESGSPVPPPGPLPPHSHQSQPPGQKAVTSSLVGQAPSARVGPHQLEAGTCLGT